MIGSIAIKLCKELWRCGRASDSVATLRAVRSAQQPIPSRPAQGLANNRGVVRVGHGIDCEHRYRFVPQNGKTSVLVSVRGRVSQC